MCIEQVQAVSTLPVLENHVAKFGNWENSHNHFSTRTKGLSRSVVPKDLVHSLME